MSIKFIDNLIINGAEWTNQSLSFTKDLIIKGFKAIPYMHAYLKRHYTHNDLKQFTHNDLEVYNDA